METTVIYTSGGGRFGNQLLNNTHLLALSLDHPELVVANLAFEPYRASYGGIDGLTPPAELSLPLPFRPWLSPLIHAPASVRLSDHPHLRGALLFLGHATATLLTSSHSLVGGNPNLSFNAPGERRRRIDLSEEETTQYLDENEVILLAGWGVRNWSSVRRHRAEIQDRLFPRGPHLQEAKSHLRKVRERHGIVVGVHVRQKDYRTWRGGRFFFESSVYHEVMKTWERNRGKAGFVIVSDEEQPDLLGKDENRYPTSRASKDGGFLADFAELSLCDVIIGPPSTFSVMAAFTGSTPFIPLRRSGGGWAFGEKLDRPLLDSVKDSEMREVVR